jgi:hypothetical protein
MVDFRLWQLFSVTSFLHDSLAVALLMNGFQSGSKGVMRCFAIAQRSQWSGRSQKGFSLYHTRVV